MIIDMEFISFMMGGVVGALLIMLAAYFIYRRSIALKLASVMIGSALAGYILAFILVKSGITLTNLIIVVGIGASIVIGLMVFITRQVITPAKFIA